MSDQPPAPPELAKEPTRGEYFRCSTGVELLQVRPADYSEDSPRHGSLCPGLLWLPSGIALVTCQVSLVPVVLRYFVKGEVSAAPAAIGVASAMGIFWGGILLSMLSFRLRRPRGKQWEQFLGDVVHWIPFPGFLTFLGLLIALAPVIWGLHLARVIP